MSEKGNYTVNVSVKRSSKIRKEKVILTGSYIIVRPDTVGESCPPTWLSVLMVVVFRTISQRVWVKWSESFYY